MALFFELICNMSVYIYRVQGLVNIHYEIITIIKLINIYHLLQFMGKTL